MPSLSYGIGVFDRDTGTLPELNCINLFAEKARTSEGEVCLQSRLGLTTLQTNGSGPVRAIYAQPGVLNGDDFSVSGSGVNATLYRVTTSLGTMATLGANAVSIAGDGDEILVVGAGGRAFHYDGTTLATTFTVGNLTNNVTACTFIGSLFCVIEADSGRVYWSTPLAANAWDALDFFTAERASDNLLDLAALNDKLVLYGQSSVEVWAHTGDSTLPFTRIEGIGSQSKGIAATGAKCEADNTLFHIGSDAVVYRLGETFERISGHWLEEKITNSVSKSMFSFKWHGHEFVCVRLDSETFAFDAATQEWCEFQTGGAQWEAQCAAMRGTTVYLGSGSDGKIYNLSGWADNGTALERKFSAAAQLDKPLSINNLRLWANVGQAATGITPTVQMRYSRDAGNTWSSWAAVDLGNATDDGSADYRVRPQWRRLGMFDDPGVLVEFKSDTASPFRVSAVKINEPGGGRSRA